MPAAERLAARRRLAGACLVLCAGTALGAELGACPLTPAIAVSSMLELPAPVQDFLAHDGPGGGATADIGARYNATDVGDTTVPMQRVQAARLGSDCIEVTVEQGGYGYSVRRLTFKKWDGGWVHTLTEKRERRTSASS